MSDTQTPEPTQELPIEEKRRSKAPAVLFTILGLAVIVALVGMPYYVTSQGIEPNQWGRFLGRFHPLLLHLPIGMLALVILLEFGKLFRKNKGSSTIAPMFFTALTAVMAAVLGYLLYRSNPGDYNAELVESHLWWGIGFAALSVAIFVVKAWVDAVGKGAGVYFLTLLGTGTVMGVAGHNGGSLTHGKTYLTEEAPLEVRKFYNKLPGVEPLEIEEEAGAGEGEVEEEESVVPPDEQVVYEAFIQPIFDQKCVTCHGPDKQKGSMRMDSYELALEGGKEGEGFEPGDAFGSNIIFRIELPLDDDEHMPPEGKKQIEEHELAVLSWWIDSGASPSAKLGELKPDEKIAAALEQLVPAEELERRKAAEAAARAREQAAREALGEAVASLQQEFPSALNFESQESSGLSFTAVSMREDFGDAQLAKLEPVMGSLVTLNLAATGVTDSGLAPLSQAERLRQLRLSETAVSDASMDLLSGLGELESLNLYGTEVTTEGVAKLAALPNLRRLYLWQTGVDEAGAATLRERMPECEIVLGVELEPVAAPEEAESEEEDEEPQPEEVEEEPKQKKEQPKEEKPESKPRAESEKVEPARAEDESAPKETPDDADRPDAGGEAAKEDEIELKGGPEVVDEEPSEETED